MGKAEVQMRIQELAEEFDVSESLVWSLYNTMPNELYDGIVSALEDLQDMGW